MHLDTARQITAERLDQWAELAHDKPVTPAALVWVNHATNGGDFEITTTEDISEWLLADILEGLARRIRFQARDAARRGRV